MRLCAPHATQQGLPRDTCETPGVTAPSRGSCMGVRMRSRRCPDCASWETSLGTLRRCVLRGRCVRHQSGTVGARARHREDARGTLRDPRASVGVLCVSQSRPLRVPMSHLGDVREMLFHRCFMESKSLSVPLPKPVDGLRQRSHRTPVERLQRSRRRVVGAAGTALVRRSVQGRHRAVMVAQRREEGGGRRESRPPHTASVRGTTCFRGMARGVEEDQRHLLRKQPLEEDDNGPMTLELLAVPDGQVGRSSRASLLLMRPRRTTPG